MKMLDADDVTFGTLFRSDCTCAMCDEEIDHGSSVAMNRKAGFLAHAACFKAQVAFKKDQHDLAHRLAAHLVEATDNWLGERGGPVVVETDTIVTGVAMFMTVWSSVARASGMPVEVHRHLTTDAAVCGLALYKHMVESEGHVPLGHVHEGEGQVLVEEDPERPADDYESPVGLKTSLAFGNLFAGLPGKPGGSGEA